MGTLGIKTHLSNPFSYCVAPDGKTITSVIVDPETIAIVGFDYVYEKACEALGVDAARCTHDLSTEVVCWPHNE